MTHKTAIILITVFFQIQSNLFCLYAQSLSKKITSVNKVSSLLEGKYLNLYLYTDQENIKLIDRIPIINRSISYENESIEDDFYLLQNPANNTFISFIWDSDINILADSLEYSKSKIINSSSNYILDSSVQYIQKRWYKRAIWKAYRDSIEKINSDNQSYLSYKKLREREVMLSESSFAQYIDLMKSWICMNYKSKISLHLLKFNHLLIPGKLLDSLKNNVIDVSLRNHKWFNAITKVENKWSLSIGQKMVNYKLFTINQKTINSEDFFGEKYLLYFWGTWCKPCKELLPKLKEVNIANKIAKYNMISIASEKDINNLNINDYIKEQNIFWPVVVEKLTGEGTLNKTMSIDIYPTIILVNTFGIIEDIAHGPKEIKLLLDNIE
jgi:thiol-disulfide isomerase/thioredoxin